MSVDWTTLLVPSASVVEIFVRGTMMYAGILVLLRLIPRRQTGSLGMTDVLLITLLADASQNGMAGEYRSITEGLVLVGTIVFWSLALDWFAYRSPALARIIEPQPLLLVRNGRLLRANLRRELITEEALESHLRERGISDVSEVEKAYVESEGRISVIRKSESRESRDGGSGRR